MFRALFSYLDLRRTVLLVAALNFSYFVVEFTFGRLYNSLALLSDSIDFLEDASINILIAFALAWSLQKQRYVSYLLALLLLVPGIAFLWNAISKLLNPVTPVGQGMSIVGFGALIINVFCALLIARHKSEEHGLVLAAFYSARNDAFTNVLIIISGFITLISPTIWPDLVVGIIIFILNADAAKEVLAATKTQVAHSRS